LATVSLQTWRLGVLEVLYDFSYICNCFCAVVASFVLLNLH